MTWLLYRSAGFGLFSNIALALVLIAATYSVHPWSLHVPWLGALLLVSVGRLAINVEFARANPAIDDLPRWRQIFMFGTGVAGLIWGCASWLYFETEELLPACCS